MISPIAPTGGRGMRPFDEYTFPAFRAEIERRLEQLDTEGPPACGLGPWVGEWTWNDWSSLLCRADFDAVYTGTYA